MVVLYGTAQVYLCTENTSENYPTRYDACTRKTLSMRIQSNDCYLNMIRYSCKSKTTQVKSIYFSTPVCCVKQPKAF